GCINIEGSGDLGVKLYLLPANSLVFSTTRVMVDFHGLKLDRFKGAGQGKRYWMLLYITTRFVKFDTD
ncbi:MAG: hypothetical protein ACYSWY_08250, partial [Planctomycetota bacterium]